MGTLVMGKLESGAVMKRFIPFAHAQSGKSSVGVCGLGCDDIVGICGIDTSRGPSDCSSRGRSSGGLLG